jgi:TolB-like protein
MRVRTREDLQHRLWPDQTFLDFEHGLNKVVHALREALGDTGNDPRFIETIPGQGYRFIPESLRSSPYPADTSQGAAAYSIAVLPINTIGTDPELTFLGRQITSGLIDSITGMSGLRVLAESTVRAHKNALSISPQRAGVSMGVQTVLAGELSKHGTALFVRAELIDVSDGAQLAGARVETTLQSGEHPEQEIVREVIGHLRPVLLPFL